MVASHSGARIEYFRRRPLQVAQNIGMLSSAMKVSSQRLQDETIDNKTSHSILRTSEVTKRQIVTSVHID